MQCARPDAVRSALPDLGALLELLAGYYHDAPAQNGRMIQDDVARQAMIDSMGQREDVVRRLIGALQPAG